jgi:hypothetical protein
VRKRKAEQNRRIASAMGHRLPASTSASKPKPASTATVVSEPRLYLCKCNFAIDLRGGFELCPKCGAAIQLSLPLAVKSKPA